MGEFLTSRKLVTGSLLSLTLLGGCSGHEAAVQNHSAEAVQPQAPTTPKESALSGSIVPEVIYPGNGTRIIHTPGTIERNGALNTENFKYTGGETLQYCIGTTLMTEALGFQNSGHVTTANTNAVECADGTITPDDSTFKQPQK